MAELRPNRGSDPDSAPGDPPRAAWHPLNTGPGRVLVAVYGLFALAACARGCVQLVTKFSEAPLAYVLSAVAGLIYLVATITLALSTTWSRRVATVAVTVELLGVLTVGTLSIADPVAFPDATVWSVYGRGYGFVPLVLPFFGLAWLWWTRPTRRNLPFNQN